MRIWPVAGKLFPGARAVIEGADARHITGVLRMGPGDVIRISDETARSFVAILEETAKNRVSITVVRPAETAQMKKPDVLLAVAISKAPVMELIAQKAVELGCAGFYPLVTQRAVGETVSPAKLERLRRIAHEACKQCGRGELMPVSAPVFPDGLPEAGLKILLWEKETGISLKSALGNSGNVERVLLVVGPAGGFSPDEAQMFREKGFVTAGLGPLVLRTETAALALLAVAGYHFGKLEDGQ